MNRPDFLEESSEKDNGLELTGQSNVPHRQPSDRLDSMIEAVMDGESERTQEQNDPLSIIIGMGQVRPNKIAPLPKIKVGGAPPELLTEHLTPLNLVQPSKEVEAKPSDSHNLYDENDLYENDVCFKK